MVKDNQVRRLFKMKITEKALAKAAMKAGMCENTARKYLRLGRLPSEIKMKHHWRTRKDPFEDDWEEIRSIVKAIPGLEVKTIYAYLQRANP